MGRAQGEFKKGLREGNEPSDAIGDNEGTERKPQPGPNAEP